MSSADFVEDLAFQRIEPEPHIQVKDQLALLAAQFYNAHRGKKMPKELTDFVIDYTPKRRQSQREIRQAVMAFAKATGAEIRYK